MHQRKPNTATLVDVPTYKAINRATTVADAEITYLFRITVRTEQESHMRALLIQSIGGQQLVCAPWRARMLSIPTRSRCGQR